MTRYGPPDDPNRPDDSPTRYLPPVEEPVPWYRKPAALVGFGAGGAVLVALIVFGLARLVMGGDSPTETTSLTPLTSTSRSAVSTTAPSQQTITETVTPTSTEPTTTTTTPTTTESTTTTTTTTTTEPTTSVSTSTSTSTVTETVTVPGG